MKIENQVRISNENTRITESNVQHIGECIAMSAIKKMMRFTGRPKSLNKLYIGLVDDIYGNRGYSEYVCVDAIGNLLRPQYVSEHFKVILSKNGLKRIRFHYLRHSCASMLLANKVPMKMIQDWFGHSDMSTTANIYSHIDYTSKIETSEVLGNVLAVNI